MRDAPTPDGDSPDELSYEDFDDVSWTEPEDLAPLDLDALGDDIPAESQVKPDKLPSGARLPRAKRVPGAPSQPRQGLLDTLDTLDDEIEPGSPPAASAAADADVGVDQDPAPEPITAAPIEASDAGAGEPGIKSRAEAVPATADTAPPESARAVSAPAVEVAKDQAAEAVETSVAAKTIGADQVAEPEGPAEPVIPPDVYCVALALPPELGAQALELRATGEIEAMPPPGVALTGRFQTADLPAVEVALAHWVRTRLPVQLETTGVLARVIGEQQYMAAWTLDPEEELQEAQQALQRALEPLIVALSGEPFAPDVCVSIGDYVPARRYPQVIGQMQRDFEPSVWHATDLRLARLTPGTGPGNWDIARTFE
jgi:hypothetical protein